MLRDTRGSTLTNGDLLRAMLLRGEGRIPYEMRLGRVIVLYEIYHRKAGTSFH